MIEADNGYKGWLEQVEERVNLILPGRTTRNMPVGMWRYWHDKELLPDEAVQAYAACRFYPTFTEQYDRTNEEEQ